MTATSDPAADANEAHPHERLPAGTLRFITCGSTGDGKSTLLGRLLQDAKLVCDDQVEAPGADPDSAGAQGGGPVFALLLDGLEAGREQRVASDVAYRVFVTGRRRFVVVDVPGHEQCTRSLLAGACTADVAVMVVDAGRGVQAQTRRHSFLLSLIGIRWVVLAVNRMDLVECSKETFDRIAQDYREYASRIGLAVVAIPVSGLRGDNVVSAGDCMPWYQGPTLLSHLESVQVEELRLQRPLRMWVQEVERLAAASHGYCGRIASGSVRPGDTVRVLPSARLSRVARIVTRNGDLPLAVAGQSVTLVLENEVDAVRGDLLNGADAPAGVADQFESTVVWMGDEPMLPGRQYVLRLGTATASATVTDLKYRVNVRTLEHIAAKQLEPNDIAVCNLSVDRALAFDAYAEDPACGGFILIDRLSSATVGAGMIHFALRRSQNIHWQAVDVDRSARAALKGHRPCVLWFTGLSAAGKSTIANLVEKRLHALGRHTYLLDGDNVRHGLNRDLGFTDADRVENIRRVGEVARLMVDAGLIVAVSFISPFRSERRLARELLEEGEFFEVFVDVPLAVAESRDPKGLYKKARSGDLKHFTGIDSPYEAPENPEIRIDAASATPEEAAELILRRLRDAGILSSI